MITLFKNCLAVILDCIESILLSLIFFILALLVYIAVVPVIVLLILLTLVSHINIRLSNDNKSENS